LGSVPHRNDPNDVAPNSIEEAVGANDDLAVRKLRKLRKMTTGAWKAL
jgi:hypothetical protein